MAIKSAAVFSKHGHGDWSHMQVVDLTERRNMLMAMLDTVYVDIVEEKSVVAIRPKPSFRPIFEVATTRAGSGIILINETPPDPEGPEAESLCSWWRLGRVELLPHPPWRKHSVTLPKPWHNSRTL